VTNWERVSVTSASTSADKSVTAPCTGTKKLLGGGASLNINNKTVSITQSYPSTDSAWTAQALEIATEGSSWTVTAWAICGTVQ
jgi:hypothetical protein